jgi:aminopeptidase
MLQDPRIEKLAALLVNYSARVTAGKKVVIVGSSVAEPLIKEVYKQVLKVGAFPFTNISLPGMNELAFKYASDEQLQFVPEPMKLTFETFDCYINILAETNTKANSTVDPQKMVLASQGRREINKIFLERAGRGDLHWALTLFPTNAYAQDAEMSLDEYADFVFNACMPDMNDPIGYWKKISARQARIVDWLKGKQQVHVTAPGTDLTLSVAGRTFINCDCHENVPDGEIFTGPVENSAEGHVTYTYPAIYGGHEVTGVQLWFEKGKAVKAKADKNEDFLLKTLDTDEGSRYLGEFAIGTNEGIQKFTGQILFDEKIGGSFHMALGAGYPETGSVADSSIHWDMICDLRHDGQITVDGDVLYKNGKFTLDF